MTRYSIAEGTMRARRRAAAWVWVGSGILLAALGYALFCLAHAVQESGLVVVVEWAVVLGMGLFFLTTLLAGARFFRAPWVEVDHILAANGTVFGRRLFPARIHPEQSMAKTVDQPRPRRHLILADQTGRRQLAIHRELLLDNGPLVKRLFPAGDGPSILDIFHLPDNGRGRRAHRTAVAGYLVLLLLVCLAIGVLGVEAWGERYLTTRGVPAAATVTGRSDSARGRARIRYFFTTRDGGKVTREATMAAPAASGLGTGSRVTVRYMTTYPDFNRLEGEYDAAVTPLLFCAAALGLAAIAMLVCHLARIDVGFTGGRMRFLSPLIVMEEGAER